MNRHLPVAIAASLVATTLTLVAAPTTAQAASGYVTQRVDTPQGTSTNPYGATRPAVSADGRYVAFVSDEPLLPGTVAPKNQHVYRYDRTTGALVQIDVSSSGAGSDGGVPYAAGLPSFGVSISDDGNVVGFHNAATTLDPGAPSYVKKADVSNPGTWWSFYARTVSTGTTQLVSQPASTASADAWTYKQVDGVISGDGTKAAFEAQVKSGSSSLVEVWLRDLTAHTTTAVSKTTSGTLSNNTTYHLPVAINRDGTVVAFEQKATTLGNTSGRSCLYVRDVAHSTLTAYSAGSSTDLHLGGFRGLSADGRYVLGSTTGTLTGAASSGGVNAVYRLDRTTGTWTLASASGTTVAAVATDASTAAISADGSSVLFATTKALVSGDTNSTNDVYSRALPSGAAVRVSLDSDDAPYTTAAGAPATSADGTVTAFQLADSSGSHVLTRSFVGSTNASFGNVSLTSGDSASGARTTAPGATRVPIANIPATSLPITSLTQLASLPIASLPIASLPIASLPIASLPIASLPIASLPIASLPLSELAFTTPQHASWDTYLAGTTYQGDPIQTVTLAQLLAISPRPSNVAALTFGEIDLSRTRLRSLSLSSLTLGSAPIASLPIKGSTSTAYNDWCSLIAALGYSCSSLGITSQSTVLALDLAGIPLASLPIASLPIASLPIASLPIASLPIASLPLSGTPIASLPIASLPIASLPIASLPIASLPTASPVRSIPIASLPSGFVTGQCNGQPCSTLGQAIDAGAVASGKTIGDIGPALGGFMLGDLMVYGSTTLGQILPSTTLSFGQVLISLLAQSDYPFEDLDLNALGVQDFASAGGTVKYVSSFTLDGSGAAIPDTTVSATIPTGWRYVPLSTTFGGPASTQPGTPDVTTPVINGSTLTWHLPYRPVGTGKAFTVTFLVRPGLAVQAAQVSTLALRASGGGLASPITASASDAPGVAVADNAADDDPATAPIADPDTLILGHISGPGDVDYYRIKANGSARLQILLSHNPQDNDLAVYKPVASVGPSAAPIASLPIASLPVTDEGTDTSTSSSQAPEGLQDLPIASLPIASLSTHRGLQTESADITESSSTGYYTIQVSGYNGAYSDQPYVLRVHSSTPQTVSCPARTFPFASENASPAAGVASVPSGTGTVYLVNTKQMKDTYGAAAVAPMLTALNSFAASGAGKGVVLTVDGDPNVRAAQAAWNAAPCNVDLANAYAHAVDALVVAARSSSSALANVVIVGGDDQIPMGRVPDGTRISNERDYAQSDKGSDGSDNPLTASQAGSNVLTDDVYGDLDPRTWLDHQLYVPDLAVGRLPESPSEVQTALSTFTAAGGRLDPSTALSTGYDFIADGAQAVDAALAPRATSGHPTLINATWDRAALSGALFPASGVSPGIAAPYAHYDHQRLLPAAGNTTGDTSDLFTVSDITSHPGKLAGRLLFTLGCHSGLNVPDSYVGGSGASVAKDWVQTYAQQGAVYVANTGFGLGDTDTVAYSEALLASFARNLDGSLTVGQALAAAKQRYVSDLGIEGVYDEKSLQEPALYGLPFWTISATPPATGSAASAPTTIAPAAANATESAPTADPITGATAQTVSIAPSFTQVNDSRGSYWTIGGGVQDTQARPLQPKTSVLVTPPSGQVVHGALITALTSSDTANVDPVYGSPTVDLTANEPESRGGPSVFPSSFVAVTTANLPYGREQRLVAVPGQFSTTGTGSTGTQRLFTGLTAQVLSSSATTFNPPQITLASASRSTASATFKVDVSSTGGVPVKRVVVVYKEQGTNAWKTVDLQHGTGSVHWYAQVPSANDVNWFTEAANASGDTASSTDKGSLFSAPVGFAATPFGNEGKSGYFTGPVTITVDGPGAPYTATVDGVDVGRADPQFQVSQDGTHTIVITGSDGSHSLQPIRVDATAPTVTFTGHPDAQFLLNAATTVPVTCTDATSGVATCPSSVTLDTSTVGVHTVPIVATDNAGNSTPGSLTYRVVYDFRGFTGATNGAVNSASAPGVLAPQFQLYDATGTSQGSLTDTSAVSSISSTQITCPAGSAVAGSATGTGLVSQLLYSPANETFTYLWVTDPAYAGTCRRLDVLTRDGLTHSLIYAF